MPSLSVSSTIVGKTTAGMDVHFHCYSLKEVIGSILLRDKHVAKMTYIPVTSEHNAEVFHSQAFRENPLFGFHELTSTREDGVIMTATVGSAVSVTVSQIALILNTEIT